MNNIQRSVELLAETLQGKNQAYAGTNGEFFNFEKAADIARVTVGDVLMTQIGIKVTRIQNLHQWDRDHITEVPFESLKDSLLDLAGYAVIAYAYLSRDDEVNYG